jgi:RNA polymerase sigma-70 factor (ECF subfamily)
MTGSIRSLDTVFRAEHPRLLRYLKRRVGPDEAPDLAQEVFARLCRSKQLDKIENHGAYLNRVTRNLLIDRARRKMVNRPVCFPFDEEWIAPTDADQTRRIEAIDLFHLYRRTVRAMPPKTRRVFIMHRMRHLTYMEIAERLGVCVQTVEYHMMRALALCRAAVAAQ